MTNLVYDMPITEVAKILSKSDRQIRRYVKEKQLKAQPVRVDGHIKLMFNVDEVTAFRQRFEEETAPGAAQVVVDARLIETEEPAQEPSISSVDIDESESAVKYVIDIMREQIDDLKKENRELHYQLEQRSGQVGFLQGKVETLQEEMKMLMPAEISEEQTARRPWYKRLFGRDKTAE